MRAESVVTFFTLEQRIPWDFIDKSAKNSFSLPTKTQRCTGIHLALVIQTVQG